MVVGTGTYENQNEAYPLDKKTLNKVALRSLLISAGKNAETGEASGWCWALAPALKRIHENESDLKLSLGHNLEYVETGAFFSTLAMGVVLSLEAQKADLETIRSTRTTINALCNSLSHSIMTLFVFSLISIACCSWAINGNYMPVIVFIVFAFVLTFITRFKLLQVGYNNGTKIMEKAIKQKDALKHASQIMGVFTIGGLIALNSRYAFVSNVFVNCVQLSSFQTILSMPYIPALLALVLTYAFYVLLTKKNWSILKCVMVVIVVGIVISLIGLLVYQGTVI